MVTPPADRSDCFTTLRPSDDHLWTAGFFNERFPDVVSPLGWSVIRRLVEQTAFREPLGFVGYHLPRDYPLTRLYRGHVYANVGIFQRLYRIFPEWLIPGDAGRYFPDADTSLRYAVPLPHPARLLGSLLRTLLSEPGWHPLNFALWDRFERRFASDVAARARLIEAGDRPAVLLEHVEGLMQASLDLLRLHRWSLTYAEVLYALLARALARWVDAGDPAGLAATLTSGLPNRSTETDAALWRLAALAGNLDPHAREALHAHDVRTFLGRLADSPTGPEFDAAFRRFLADYGHRSPGLDLRHPAYADDPGAVLRVVTDLRRAGGVGPIEREQAQAERRRAALRQIRRQLAGRPVRWCSLRLLVWLAQRYSILRENQRFHWQQSLHAKRRAFLRIGQAWSAAGRLAQADDVFFLTLSEIEGLERGWLPGPALRSLVTVRRAQFEALQVAPYPAFLRGASPLAQAGIVEDRRPGALSGLAASPGRARGPALVVPGPAALTDAWRRAAADSILVAGSTDPVWTPLFLRVAGLVMERGGPLSHGAVVAREYGLPAVVGVAGALDRIADGQLIEVDGGAGTVTLLPA